MSQKVTPPETMNIIRDVENILDPSALIRSRKVWLLKLTYFKMEDNISVVYNNELQKCHEKDFVIQKVKLLKEKEGQQHNKCHHESIVSSFSSSQPQYTPNGRETQRNYVDKCLKNLVGRKYITHQCPHTRPQLNNGETVVPKTAVCYQSQLEYLRNECSLYRMERKIQSLQQAPPCISQDRRVFLGNKTTFIGGHCDVTDFIQRKYHLLVGLQYHQVTEMQFQERIHNSTGPILIADIIKGGPKPSDAPDVIWRSLLNKLPSNTSDTIQD